MPLRFTLSLISLLLVCSPVFAQTTVKGNIADNEQQRIPYTVVIAQSLPDSGVIKMEIADSMGNYLLNIPEYSSLLLKASSPGYSTGYKLVDISQDIAEVNFTLNLAANKLKGRVF